MEVAQLKYVLAELNFSAAFPDSVLGHLAVNSIAMCIPSGALVFREGVENKHLFLVRRGMLALEMNVPGRGAIRILTVGPGEMAGWSALLSPGKMTATAIAVEDSEVIAADATKLVELCDQNHEFGYHVMRQMASAVSKRLTATRLQMLDLFADAPASPRLTSVTKETE